VQQYGYKYSYTSRNLSVNDKTDEIPQFIEPVSQKLRTYFNGKLPQQLIINEYTPGQGINPHTDAKVFGDPIISVSLGSSCEFLFDNTDLKYSLFLKPRTLVVMSGESRYKWKHSIPNKKNDVDPVTKEIVKRGTRVSLTFRILA